MKAWILFCGTLFTFLSSAHADPFFSSPVRTHNYSGWNSAIQGDINYTGMAGATVAVPDSLSGAEANPAGFAMTVTSISAQISSNTTRDPHIQQSGNDTYNTNQWGLAVSPPPWGFGMNYSVPSIESGDYVSPNTGHDLKTEVSVEAFRVGVAHAFFQSKLSLGIDIGFSSATRNLGPYSFGGTALNTEFGALYRLHDRILIGASFQPGSTIKPSGSAQTQTELPGFNQAILMPSVFAVGVAWVPNRFFKLGTDLHIVGTTPNSALLANENEIVGASWTLQPRLGGSYRFAEFKNFTLEYQLGTYFETSRIEGVSDRLHGTTSLEMTAWFVNTGVGFDYADQYQNFILVVGIDVIRTLRVFDIIPNDPSPPYQGFFPPPTRQVPEGLPQGMTDGEPRTDTPISVQDATRIIKNIPTRIQQKVSPKQKQKKKKNKKPTPAAPDQAASSSG